MTRPTLDQMLDAEGERIMEAMKSCNGQIPASWAAFLEDGSRVRIETPFPDDISEIAKQIAIALIRKQLKSMGAWGYTLSAEAWMSLPAEHSADMRDDENARHRTSRPAPDQDPNRVEVLIVMAITRKEKRSRTWKMIRNARGRLIDFSLHEMAGDGIGGPFTELLD